MAEQAWFAFSDTFKSSMLFQGSMYSGTTMGYGQKADSDSFKWDYKLPAGATSQEQGVKKVMDKIKSLIKNDDIDDFKKTIFDNEVEIPVKGTFIYSNKHGSSIDNKF